MNKVIIKILIISLIISACSLEKTSKLWKDKNKEEITKVNKVKKIFTTNKISKKEFNPLLKINLKESYNKKNLSSILNNNLGRYDYQSILDEKLKFKFSKIKTFNKNEPQVVFYQSDMIFFDKKGSVIRFDNLSKQKWKSNHYSKTQKKSKPFLFMATHNETLVIADNIAKYYAININNGNLIWSKNNSSPFNSEIKIYKDKIYIVDLENILHCFSLIDGKKIWSHKTENVLIKSQKKLSIVINNNIVYFNNSIGDITAVGADKGNLIWQLPTQNNDIYAQSFSLKNSNLVLSNKTIFFSNNRNEFYSVNSETGFINWKQDINSIVQPIIIDNIVITVSSKGFLIFIDRLSGNIIRITDILDNFNEKKRSKITPIGFVVGTKNIYLTLNNGRLLVVDIQKGKTEEIIKIDGNKISKPFVRNNALYIIKDNAVIRFE